MPTIPLYDTSAPADAWHKVIAPGGYEWWTFDAESTDGSMRLWVRFCLGGFHEEEYRERYLAYLKAPTRNAPPTAGEYPSVMVMVMLSGQAPIVGVVRYRPEEFSASSGELQFAMGKSRVNPVVCGYHIHADIGASNGPPITIDMIFPKPSPVIPGEGVKSYFLGRVGPNGRHHWIVSGVSWRATGEIRIGERRLDFGGWGFLDHCFGTVPIAKGFQHFTSGRIFQANSITAFQITQSANGKTRETELIVADEAGVRCISGNGVDFGSELILEEPTVLYSTPAVTLLRWNAKLHGEKEVAFGDSVL